MRTLIFILVVLLVAGGGIYYYYHIYPPVVLRSQVQDRLAAFDTAVGTKQRGNVTGMLGELLAEDARIGLNVGFYTLSQRHGNTPSAQEFTKESFVAFIDNLLYTLEEYSSLSQLQTFRLAEDRKTATTDFHLQGAATGMSYYGGLGVGMQFSADTNCQADISFALTPPQMTRLTCEVKFRSSPKPSEVEKLKTPEAYQQLMLR